MPVRPPIYGFDLITDVVGSVVDPAVHRVQAIAVSTARSTELLADDDEASLLENLDVFLHSLEPGVISTWNGSLLDLPFLAFRADANGVSLGLTTRPDRRSAPDSPILDLDNAVCGSWDHHQHLDLRRVYAAVSRWRKRGRLDPESLIPPANELAPRDPIKDARLARHLAERRWSQARKFVDRMPDRAGSGAATLLNPAAEASLLTDRAVGETSSDPQLRRRRTD